MLCVTCLVCIAQASSGLEAVLLRDLHHDRIKVALIKKVGVSKQRAVAVANRLLAHAD